jgi:hypothetical protein
MRRSQGLSCPLKHPRPPTMWCTCMSTILPSPQPPCSPQWRHQAPTLLQTSFLTSERTRIFSFVPFLLIKAQEQRKKRVCVRVCVSVCVRACVRACVRVCVRAQ